MESHPHGRPWVDAASKTARRGGYRKTARWSAAIAVLAIGIAIIFALSPGLTAFQQSRLLIPVDRASGTPEASPSRSPTPSDAQATLQKLAHSDSPRFIQTPSAPAPSQVSLPSPQPAGCLSPTSPPADSGTGSPAPSPIAQQLGNTPGLAPNQIDLGIGVINLTVLNVNTESSPDCLGPYYELDVTMFTTDPSTQTAVSSEDSAGENGGCSGMWVCGVFPFAFATVYPAEIELQLFDNQNCCLGGNDAVNINGGSSTYFVEIPELLQENFLGPSGQACSIGEPVCQYTISGTSGSRTASITFQVTVETSLLSQSSGRDSTYGAFNEYFQQILAGSSGYPIVCPSAAALLSPDTAQILQAAEIAVFVLLTAVVASSTFGLGLLAQFGGMALELGENAFDIYQTWGEETYINYPANVDAIPALQGGTQLSAVGCADMELFWETNYEGGSGALIGDTLSNFLSGFAAVQSANGATQAALVSGSASAAASAMNAQVNVDNTFESDASSLNLELLELEDGDVLGCVIPSCDAVGGWIDENLVEPLADVVSQDEIVLEDSSSLLSTLTSDFSASCSFPSSAYAGVAYSGTVTVTAGYPPYVLSGVPTWLSETALSGGVYTLSGTTPTTSGTYTISLRFTDDASSATAGCSSSVAVGWTPELSISPTSVSAGSSITVTTTVVGSAGAPYSYSYNALPPGCSSSAASFSCDPTTAGTYSVTATVVSASGSFEISNAVTVTVTGSEPKYAVHFTESGLASGLSWSAGIDSVYGSAVAGSTITVDVYAGTYTYDFNVVDVLLDGCLVEYYSPSPASGTAAISASGATFHTTYTLYDVTSSPAPVGDHPIHKCLGPALSPVTSVGSPIGSPSVSASLAAYGTAAPAAARPSVA